MAIGTRLVSTEDELKATHHSSFGQGDAWYLLIDRAAQVGQLQKRPDAPLRPCGGGIPYGIRIPIHAVDYADAGSCDHLVTDRAAPLRNRAVYRVVEGVLTQQYGATRVHSVQRRITHTDSLARHRFIGSRGLHA